LAHCSGTNSNISSSFNTTDPAACLLSSKGKASNWCQLGKCRAGKAATSSLILGQFFLKRERIRWHHWYYILNWIIYHVDGKR
jgi:hypothetical protein